MWNENPVDIKFLEGKVAVNIRKSETELAFVLSDGQTVLFNHNQDCCEYVCIDDVCGDLEDLKNTPILSAEEVMNPTDVEAKESYEESFTWTFYHFRTIKGTVTVKWYGSSNGYYSETVDICLLED